MNSLNKKFLIYNLLKKLDDGYDYGYVLPSVKVDDEKKELKNSLHIKTDYPASCNWIGMGIGWDAWKGKDLTGIIEGAAIEFMARVDKGPIFNIPIVFILEDYSANQCYATASYLGISGGSITQKWTKVTVPLPTFSYNINKLDLTNKLVLYFHNSQPHLIIYSLSHQRCKLMANLSQLSEKN